MYCRCRGYCCSWSESLSLSHACTQTHTRVGLLWTRDWDFAEASLPDNAQHSEQTTIHALSGIQTCSPSKQRPQTHALDDVATNIGCIFFMFELIELAQWVFFVFRSSVRFEDFWNLSIQIVYPLWSKGYLDSVIVTGVWFVPLLIRWDCVTVSFPFIYSMSLQPMACSYIYKLCVFAVTITQLTPWP